MQLLRALKQRFGIAAPRVAVRTHVPWYWRWVGIVIVAALALGTGWATYDSGVLFAGYRQSEADGALMKLSQTIARQEQEISALRTRAAVAERQIAIDRATYGDLASQMKSLAEQNAALKEDLAFFQTLMPTVGGDAKIMIDRFSVRHEMLPGEYRYRLLLVQTGQREKDFRGRLQLVVSLSQNEKAHVLTLPSEGETDAKGYEVRFRFFQRIEGSFRVAPDANVNSIQVRVFENGSKTPKLTQTVSAS
jgi:uncharacterized coiled-coil protein SlyX